MLLTPTTIHSMWDTNKPSEKILTIAIPLMIILETLHRILHRKNLVNIMINVLKIVVYNEIYRVLVFDYKKISGMIS